MDRVKTSLFDILRPRLEGLAVLDLFAGSGSVGIEALSQGAGSCTFIDLGREAIATIRKNLAATGLADRAQVLQVDALDYLRRATDSFDLIYVAPPQYKDLWAEAIVRIDARAELLARARTGSDDDRPGGLVIAQIHPKEYHRLELAALHEVRQKQYGNTLLVFFERTAAPSPALEDRP
jgi:16S rRNA (guanine(966)-N(2))-methyltransferase RsmD